MAVKKTLLTGMPYVPSGSTDIRKTFAAERRRLKAIADAQAEAVAKVTPLTRKERK